jgi:hypothetical protein
VERHTVISALLYDAVLFNQAYSRNPYANPE